MCVVPWIVSHSVELHIYLFSLMSKLYTVGSTLSDEKSGVFESFKEFKNMVKKKITLRSLG